MSTYKTMITIITEKSPDLTGLMVMVDTKSGGKLRLISQADETFAVLLREKLVILSFGNSVFGTKMRSSAQSPQSSLFTRGSRTTFVKYLGPVL